MKNKPFSEERLSDVFAEIDKIDPDEEAKQRAIHLANKAFLQAQPKRRSTTASKKAHLKEKAANQKIFSTSDQGSDKNGRPMGIFLTSMVQTLRNTIMQAFLKPNNNRAIYGALGTSFVFVVGVLIAINNPNTNFSERNAEGYTAPELNTKSDQGSPMKSLEKSSLGVSEEAIASTELDTFSDSIVHTEAAPKRTESLNFAPAVQLEKPLQKVAAAPQPLAMEQSASSLFGSGQTVSEPIAREPKEYRDKFEIIEINNIKKVSEHPVSTFSIDVDTASYSFVRRQLNTGVLPNKDSVRIEEMLNYFDYNYPTPKDKSVPFNTQISVLDSPWNKGNKLVHIGLKGYEISNTAKPKSNLVFLLDVSSSMAASDKLPLVKQSMNMLLSQLNPSDTVAIAVYAGAAGTILEPTPANEKQKILDAMNRLNAGGSTAGAEGIKLAYQLAENNFDKNAVNRVILATDGDFNVGIADHNQLKQFVERKRDKGIFLSVLGFGAGNYNDQLMQSLAQNGNGVAAYIDTLSEAQKVLVDEANSTLFSIAKDVKIQVEFNPKTVTEYRLIGYETRALNREDFNNDKVDAGDIGAGHTVTAIYEITPTASDNRLIDQSRYSSKSSSTDSAQDELKADEYGFIKLRYKLPKENTSKRISQPISISENTLTSELKQEVNFSIAVAGFAQLLKDEKFIREEWGYDQALNLAQRNKGEDLFGYRTELVQLIRKAKTASAM